MYHKGTLGGNAFIIKYYFMQHESACESHTQAQYWRICLPLACLLVHHWVDASIQYFIFGKSLESAKSCHSCLWNVVLLLKTKILE